jgi:DTW domain-containing protein YfiP
VPDLALDEGTVLLYPCDDAVDIAELDRSTVTRVVFVDSTWSQCSSILSHPALVGLRRVKIASEQTLFWRPQNKKPDTHLATIEAIYHFFRQFPLPDGVPVYDGRYVRMEEREGEGGQCDCIRFPIVVLLNLR